MSDLPKKKKKKRRSASQWEGYSPEQKRQYDMQFGNETKRDKGFFGHTKAQTLF